MSRVGTLSAFSHVILDFLDVGLGLGDIYVVFYA